jgi:acetolactate synthase-1/3 small subunit
VKFDQPSRDYLLALVETAGAGLVDERGDLATVMLAGHPDELDAFASALASGGIIELQRTGSIALPKLD